MGCKHISVEGNTTKYFICRISGKAVDDVKCSKCMLKIEDTSTDEIFNNFMKGIFNTNNGGM